MSPEATQPGDGTDRDMKRPDPEDDPFACSRCGQPLGTIKRVEGEDYCDPCLSEMGFAVEGYV